jgi:hypothetical protein
MIFQSRFHYVNILLYFLFVHFIHLCMYLLLYLLLYMLLILFFTIDSNIFRNFFILRRLSADWGKVCWFFCWVWSTIWLFLFLRLFFFYLFFFSFFFFLWINNWVIRQRNGRRLLLNRNTFILNRFFSWITVFDIFKTLYLLHVIFRKLVLYIYAFIFLLIHFI